MADLNGARDRFARDELIEVLSHYDVGVIRTAKEFSRGSRRAPKVVLETPNGRYLLKRRAAGRDDPTRVEFVHTLMAHLRGKSFPVPRIIRTCDDNSTVLRMGGRVYEVFQFVEGDTFDGSLEQATHAGHVLARFHESVADFVCVWRLAPGGYHDTPNVRAGLNAIPSAMSSHDSVAGFEEELIGLTQTLRAIYDRAADTANDFGCKNLPRTITHGDWHPGNIVFDGQRVSAVLDLDAAREQPAVIDLASGMLQFSILRNTLDPDAWPDYFDEGRMRRFLQGYASREAVSDNERRAIPALMIEALIAEAAVPIAATGSFGSLPGFGILQMVTRKVQWIEENGERMLEQWLLH